MLSDWDSFKMTDPIMKIQRESKEVRSAAKDWLKVAVTPIRQKSLKTEKNNLLRVEEALKTSICNQYEIKKIRVMNNETAKERVKRMLENVEHSRSTIQENGGTRVPRLQIEDPYEQFEDLPSNECRMTVSDIRPWHFFKYEPEPEPIQHYSEESFRQLLNNDSKRYFDMQDFRNEQKSINV